MRQGLSRRHGLSQGNGSRLAAPLRRGDVNAVVIAVLGCSPAFVTRLMEKTGTASPQAFNTIESIALFLLELRQSPFKNNSIEFVLVARGLFGLEESFDVDSANGDTIEVNGHRVGLQ